MSQFLDASNPAHAESFFQRAGALASNRQYAAALDNLDIAVRLAPRNAGTWCNRGNALRELNRIAEALDSYKESIALNPNLAEAHANRAAALFDLKRYDEAASGFQAVVALNPRRTSRILLLRWRNPRNVWQIFALNYARRNTRSPCLIRRA
jgi:tetratricopeptide (TPR) repeat protein